MKCLARLRRREWPAQPSPNPRAGGTDIVWLSVGSLRKIDFGLALLPARPALSARSRGAEELIRGSLHVRASTSLGARSLRIKRPEIEEQ
jgi:hypothetical protein